MALRLAAIFVFALLSIASTVAVEEPYVYEPFVSKHSVAVRAPIEFKTCGGYADVSDVDIEPLIKTKEGRYEFKKGSTVNITVQFKLKAIMKSGKLTIYGKVGAIKMKIAETDVCKGHNLDCPLEKGEDYKFVMSLLVKEAFPSVRATIQAEVKGRVGTMVLCINFAAIITG